jgi:hypothetical protein
VTGRGRGGLNDLEHGRKALPAAAAPVCFGNPIDDDINLAPAGHRLRVPALFMGKLVACRSN